jgi:hypothetical protein
MTRAILLLLAGCLLFQAGCSPASALPVPPGLPRLVHLQTEAPGDSHLVAQDDLLSSPIPLTFSIPGGCTVYRLHPNPVAAVLAAELLCGDKPAVQTGELVSSGQIFPAFYDQARFLAWSADGRYLYLKFNLPAEAYILRYDLVSKTEKLLSIPSVTYDLAALPGGRIQYSLTYGIGFGSEVWTADSDGSHPRRILSRPAGIVAYLRPSPDGSQVAFILFPDSQTPYPNGDLWVMDAEGENARRLAAADAGHGYAPAWSPDGAQIAFVVRENPDEARADLSASALISNIYRIRVQDAALTPVTAFSDAIVEAPVWSPDGSSLVFNVVKNDTIQVWYDASGTLQPLVSGSSCCAVWVPER